jgi:hypothetical protein
VGLAAGRRDLDLQAFEEAGGHLEVVAGAHRLAGAGLHRKPVQPSMKRPAIATKTTDDAAFIQLASRLDEHQSRA